MRPWLLALTLLFAAAPAGAQSAAQLGAQHYRTGAEAFARREFRVAAIEFRTAYELTHEPALLFNLGAALALDERRDEAREAFERYLRERPDAPNRAQVEARLHDLRAPASSVRTAAVPGRSQPPARFVAPPTTPTAAAGSPVRAAGVVVGSVGLLALGIGAGLYVDVGSQYDTCAVRRCPAILQPRGEDAASVALLWAGGALTVAGLVTFFAAPRRGASAGAHVMVVPQARGLTVAGVF